MDYKSSYYNFIYDDLGTDKTVFYNSSTGALAIVKDAQYQEYKNYINNHREFEDKEFFENLKKCGYIVPNSIDEKFMLHLRLMENRYTGNTLFLTIAPTMACNFRCVYCFEKGHYGNKKMDEETSNNVFAFFKEKAKGVKRALVSWYGGEPLLGMTIIEKLAPKFIEYCENNNIQYSSNIITNGYLFTKEIAQKLSSMGVKWAQITLDGSKEIHDQRRPLINGQGTFDIIMKNIIETKGVLPVALRINVDKNNIKQADEIVQILRNHDLLNTVHPYLGHVISYNEGYSEDLCLSSELYSKENTDFIMRNSLPFKSSYPTPKGHYCSADYCNGWVIDDQGNLYKCWNDIGMLDYSIGNINCSPIINKTVYYSQYMMFNPKNNSMCEVCKMAPICLGGCPHSRLEGRMVCAYTENSLKNILLEHVKALYHPDSKNA